MILFRHSLQASQEGEDLFSSPRLPVHVAASGEKRLVVRHEIESFPAIRDCFRKHPLLHVVQPQLPVRPCELRFQFENPPYVASQARMKLEKGEAGSSRTISRPSLRASSWRPIAIKNWLYHCCTSALLGLSRTARLCSCLAPAHPSHRPA